MSGAKSSVFRIIKCIVAFGLVPVLLSIVILAAIVIVNSTAQDWLRRSTVGMNVREQFWIAYFAAWICPVVAWIAGPVIYELQGPNGRHLLRTYIAVGGTIGFAFAAPFFLPGLDLIGSAVGLFALVALMQLVLLGVIYALALRYSLLWLGLIGARSKHA